MLFENLLRRVSHSEKSGDSHTHAHQTGSIAECTTARNNRKEKQTNKHNMTRFFRRLCGDVKIIRRWENREKEKIGTRTHLREEQTQTYTQAHHTGRESESREIGSIQIH